MTLVLLGNYAQTGHFGGPLAYTPYNVATHLAAPISVDCASTTVVPNILQRQVHARRRALHSDVLRTVDADGSGAGAEVREATGNKRYYTDPHVAILPIDALGFRRGAGAMMTLLKDHGLADHPLFAQAKLRGFVRLAGHAESTDVTNDVNGGPSGIGIATAAGKTAFWDVMGAGIAAPKVIAFEGEFATEGHAQELKTQALALKVGKRLRVMFSDNNAGIDDALIGGVIDRKCDGYRLIDQWTSYGWNVFVVQDGSAYDQVVAALKTMEHWDPADRRPMIAIGKTTKGYWPAAVDPRFPTSGIRLSATEPSVCDEDELGYFLALAKTFEKRYGVEFQGIRDGAVKDPRERLVQFKTNIDVVMSLLNHNGIGDWLADRLVENGESLPDSIPLRLQVNPDPFQDERLRVANLPVEPQKVAITNTVTGATKDVSIALFRKAGEVAGTRRASRRL